MSDVGLACPLIGLLFQHLLTPARVVKTVRILTQHPSAAMADPKGRFASMQQPDALRGLQLVYFLQHLNHEHRRCR